MAASAFLGKEGWFEAISLPQVNIYHCEFSIADYHDRLFGELGVPWSQNLARAVDKRKSEFLAGRYCAAKVLSSFGVSGFTVQADEKRCPLWPAGFKGAISHSKNIAMVALSQRQDILGIGIDIEQIMSEQTMDNVKGAIVHGPENRHLERTDITANAATSLIFSIKESFFKAAYPSTGYYFDFDAVTVDTIDTETRRFSLTVKQDLNPRLQPGMEFGGLFVFVEEQVLSLLLL